MPPAQLPLNKPKAYNIGDFSSCKGILTLWIEGEYLFGESKTSDSVYQVRLNRCAYEIVYGGMSFPMGFILYKFK